MKSKYALYIKELKDYEMYEDEHGFVIYGVMDDGIYIEDIFVLPEYREKDIASKYANIIEDKAKKEGYACLYGSVVPSLKNSHYRNLVLLGYGFKVHAAEQNIIWYKKEI
jgi:GNAT superfamily N-acetyltransferase